MKQQLAVFFISIYKNQLYHFVSSNFLLKLHNMRVGILGDGLKLNFAKALVNLKLMSV